jgi:L-fucose isomerase-like protein
MVIGVIVGNRGFFPDHLAKSGREDILRVLEAAQMEVVALTPEESKYGAVETREESRRCADLFKRHRDRIDGIIVTLPNFGEERAIADALRLADLRVPVLIQATPDDPEKMTIAFRRDSFCGKMSACNNLRQYGIPYSITTLHTESPDSPEFAKDWNGSQRSAEWSKDFAICVSAPSARARPLSTPCATARRYWNRKASQSRRSIFPKCSAASRA